MVGLPDIGSGGRGRRLGVDDGEAPRRGSSGSGSDDASGRTSAAAVRRAERPRPPRSAVAGEPPTSPGPAGRRAAVGTAGPTRPDRPGRPARPAGGTARVREDDHARAVGRGRGSPVGLGEARRDGQRPGHDGHRHRGRGLRRPGSRRAVVGPGPGCGGPAGRGGRRARDGAGRGRARRAGAGRPAHDPAQRGTEGRRGSGGRVAGRVGDRGRQPVAAADAARPAAQPGSAAGVRAGRLRVRVGRDRRPAAQARRRPVRRRDPEDRRAHRGVAGGGLPGRPVDRRAAGADRGRRGDRRQQPLHHGLLPRRGTDPPFGADGPVPAADLGAGPHLRLALRRGAGHDRLRRLAERAPGAQPVHHSGGRPGRVVSLPPAVRRDAPVGIAPARARRGITGPPPSGRLVRGARATRPGRPVRDGRRRPAHRGPTDHR